MAQTARANIQNPDMAIQLAFINMSANTPNFTAFRTSMGSKDFKALNNGRAIIKVKNRMKIIAK